jgi:hypothetical protein
MMPKNLNDLYSMPTWFPSAFARLAYFATIRDTYTGKYMHQAWRREDSEEEIHRFLQAQHQETFDAVVELSVADLCVQLKAYFVSLAGRGNVGQTGKIWLDIESYVDMVPQGSSAFDRRLFHLQMRAALEVLVSAPEVTSPTEHFPAESIASQSPPPDRQFQRHRDN